MSLSSLLGGQAARIVTRFADADTHVCTDQTTRRHAHRLSDTFHPVCRRETVNVRLPDGRDEEQYLFGAADNICGTVSAASACTCHHGQARLTVPPVPPCA